MTDEDLKQIEALMVKHKARIPDGGCGSGCLMCIFVLFILGTFKGCGY